MVGVAMMSVLHVLLKEILSVGDCDKDSDAWEDTTSDQTLSPTSGLKTYLLVSFLQSSRAKPY